MFHANLATRLACLVIVITGLMLSLSSAPLGSHAASDGPTSTAHSQATAQSISIPQAQHPSTSVPSEPKEQQARISEAYGKLPLSFEANQGQSDPEVKFISRGSGYSLFLTSTEAVLALSRAVKPENSGNLAAGQKESGAQSSSTSSAVLRMKLLGANPRPQVSGVEKQPGLTSYFIGNDRNQWRTNIENYAQVRYESVYPGIDVIYYGNQRQLEYDFVVAPFANPDRIRLAFAGASKMFVDANGELVLKTAGGEVRQRCPVVYQMVDGTRREIAGRYAIRARRGRQQEVGLELGAYDRSRALVIDPVLVYSTYLGGTATDRGYGIAVDGSGNAYITGITTSVNFPTVNPLQGSRNGVNSDAYVVKLNAAGTALVYATYLGGTGSETAYGIAVDGGGNTYITGFTTSSDFPAVNSAQSIYKGGGDVFVAKLNASGASLVYSTYWGGASSDKGYGIAVDSTGNTYVTGATQSGDMTTVNALQSLRRGSAAFKSTNGGGSWTASGTGLNASTVHAFVVDPINPTTVYAATEVGVYKSTDSGNNWSAASSGLPGTPISALVIDRVNTAILYASTFTGVYKTTNGGASWTQLSNLPPADVRALAIDPVNTQTVYAGTLFGDRPIYKSTNGGATWNPSDTNLPVSASVLFMTIDPSNPSIIYARVDDALYRSPNAGASWSGPLVINPNGVTPLSLAVSPSDPTTLYAGTDNGLYKSTNSGTTWTKTNLPSSFYAVYSVVIDPTNSATVYVGTNDRNISKSTDGGQTWSSTTVGFDTQTEIVLAINPTNTALLYAGGYSGSDALLLKLNPSGAAAVYSTYIGGDSTDTAFGVAADAAGNAYIAGPTSSSNFPTANALQSAQGSQPFDAFVAKINPTGSAFVYSTYLGGSESETASAIAVDSGGNAYVTGITFSADFPTTPSALQASCASCTPFGSGDAYVTKLNPAGSAIVYSTYLGGSDNDWAHGIAVDAAGNAYITGETDSSNLLIVGGAPQAVKNLSTDAFVAKINPAGSSLVYSTYLGGNGDDYGFGIAVGPTGSAYVAGQTISTNFPVANALQANRGGSVDAFVARIAPSDTSGASADLSLAMSDSPDPAQTSQNITYTLTVTNSGPSTATGVIVNDSPPLAVANFVSATPSQGTCTQQGATVTCNLGQLASGAQATISVVVTPVGAGSITNSAGVGGNEPDPNTANNTATQTTTVVAAISISGTITRSGNGLSGVTVTLSGSQSATTTTDVNGVYTFIGLTPGGNYTVTPSMTNITFSPQNLVFNNLSFNVTGANFIGTTAPSTLQLNQSSYSIAEGAGSLAFLVNRSGDLSLPVTVNYTTTDAANFLQNCNVTNGRATSRCDYVSLVGTLHFASGENSKTLFLPIVDDTYLEGSETLFITLTNPTGGATLGTNQQATVTITDNGNDAAGTPNPIDTTDFFVRQHYIDFLGREPDPAAIGWVNQINNCVPSQPSCDRLSVSQGIYNSPEFKDRGYFIYKFYSVALGRKPSYDEFVLDRARVSGFQSDAELEQSKQDFIADFMSRPQFGGYNGLTNDQYVQTLFSTAGVSQVTVNGTVLNVAAMQQSLATGQRTRARVLRDIAESPEVSARFQVESTIVMHYFGYLRRDPDAAYQDWINIYNQTGDARNVTNGFVNSQEYRMRFGQ